MVIKVAVGTGFTKSERHLKVEAISFFDCNNFNEGHMELGLKLLEFNGEKMVDVWEGVKFQLLKESSFKNHSEANLWLLWILKKTVDWLRFYDRHVQHPSAKKPAFNDKKMNPFFKIKL